MIFGSFKKQSIFSLKRRAIGFGEKVKSLVDVNRNTELESDFHYANLRFLASSHFP